MQHTCQDCDHLFTVAGQNEPLIAPAVQCPNCHSYRTQPSPVKDEMAQRDMPDAGSGDDMGGNPLQEGILADGGWKNRDVRDESFASSTRRMSLFEMPEFETTNLVAPPDLYRHGLETEGAHRAHVQLPKGITDNLHAALGNLQAWVENPHENGQLRPYYNKYWKVIRPQFMKPGSLQIGVADPTMAEIVNHVAQTDDLAPLYEYRGRTSATRVAGPAMALGLEALAPEGLAAAGGGLGVGGAAGAGGEAAGAAAADSAGTSASGVGGLMNKVMQGFTPQKAGAGAAFEVGKNMMGQGLGMVDDVFGMGGNGGAGGGSDMGVHDPSFYARVASDEDDAFPASHDEAPKNDDGDAKEKDDGNSHEWQRDLSVNDMGGTDHSPSFDPGGAAFTRFKMLFPLIQQFLESGEDGSQDPLIQGLHHSLESEIPGYLDHADEHAGHKLIMILSPQDDAKPAPEKDEETHTDENSGGKHESHVAHLEGEGAVFLPDLTVTPPSLRGAAMYPHRPSEIPSGVLSGPVHPEEEMLDSASWPQNAGPEHCPFCGHYAPTSLGLCVGCGREVYPHGQAQAQAMQHAAKTADTQGPHTPEQIQAVQQWLLEHGKSMGLEGDELMQTLLSVPTNPLEFADILAQIQQTEPPPPPPDGGLSGNPPMPAQENAPPGATMPVPGMDAGPQMMAAVKRYAADSVAGECPKCGSHTTEILDDEGTSQCHGCGNIFKTEGKTPKKLDTTSSTWCVDEDLLREAAAVTALRTHPGDDGDSEPVQGVPIADQQGQEDLRQEQDSGHTWTDEDGNPLKVGQEYEMFSDKYDIPDLMRIEAVKPSSLTYTLTGEYGFGHAVELTKEEANLERTTFRSTTQEGELGTDDSLEENNDDNTGYTGSPEHTDMSAPHGLVSAGVIESGVTQQDNPRLSWLKAEMPRTAGAHYTPMEQRALIEESGVARNADKLDLSNTHYITDADDDQFVFGL